MKATMLVTNIGELATPRGRSPASGKAMSDIELVKDAVIVVDVDKIAWVGPARALPSIEGPAPDVVDAGGRAAIPGFVDSHTHFIFGGYRDEEFLWRAEGLPYMEIHKRGGGIATSVAATRAATTLDLVRSGALRLTRMLELGVTTVEGKSGYGLDLETEMRQLDAMKTLMGLQSVDIVPTFMGMHSIPAEFQGQPSAYTDFVLSTVLPMIKKQGIAQFCDVFCEKGVFELVDSSRFLQIGRAHV